MKVYAGKVTTLVTTLVSYRCPWLSTRQVLVPGWESLQSTNDIFQVIYTCIYIYLLA